MPLGLVGPPLGQRREIEDPFKGGITTDVGKERATEGEKVQPLHGGGGGGFQGLLDGVVDVEAVNQEADTSRHREILPQKKSPGS